MPTLRTPDGRRYQTDDAAEITNLTLGHGYTVERDEPEQHTAESRARRPKPPASPGRADTTVEGETTP